MSLISSSPYAPPFMTGDDTVFVYGEWFNHLDGLEQIDWRMIGRAIQQVLGDHAKVISSPPNEADWEKMKNLHTRFLKIGWIKWLEKLNRCGVF